MAAEQNNDAERAAFEAWFAENKFGGMRESMWAAWEARAARRPPASIGEDGLPEPKYPQMKVLIHGNASEQCGYTAEQLATVVRSGVDDLMRIHAALGLPDDAVIDADTMIERIADLRAQLARQSQKPVAWMRDNGKECITAASKVWMQGAGFGHWASVAKEYTTPLYAAPPLSSEQQEKGVD
jgi:hypothetical protein